MYQEFNVLSISTSLLEKKVSIEFSLDVNEDTVGLDTLVLAERASSKIVDTKVSVDRNVVELELVDWPIPNTEYLLKVQKGVSSIVDDELPDSLQRNLVFKSEITSVVEVLSPADHEEINELLITWKETQDRSSENLVSSYYLEIALENAFYNVVKKTEVHGKEDIKLSGLQDGQYFLRVRAQKDGQYGPWSDTVTFIVSGENKKPGSVYEDEEEFEGPIYEEELTIVASPVNGESPGSFLIEFDEELDADMIQEIVVVRRKF
ncbi:fibronectin type III domain-containing protein [Bacillus atrophaeus]|uniref:fibronectin type III domain-containing protein n=1 Tax=Bacillus atrophaeus TaxID=1452 RepID=UPI002282CE2E|nr:fibronectin type III domain-containing protein [Bacillus atrophaeus]MCY7866102.1 fibronectin type III domain-containing protein [Bacillus spizizenii]MCY8890334.1 fibronectin type III domain-containing protein [Bacillus spizizenii]MEC0842058.1 fibronectin type III domain-containing protein [Bacillus spizizenii]MED1125325.1 fibronectin type III domain-containing protein [Bacillus atrophaeus]